MADEHGPDAPANLPQGAVFGWEAFPGSEQTRTPRRYLPTLADLVDRLCICQLKAVFIPEHHDAYVAECRLIEHDISVVLREKGSFIDAGKLVAAVAMLMLTNRYIWENESKARQGGSEQDKLLKLTHSINGCRNRAKNVIATLVLDRAERKTDCFAADFGTDFGNWDVLDGPAQG